MLKVLTSSCLHGRFQTAAATTLHSHLRHGTESNSPLLQLLGSPRGSDRINPNFYRRAFFCSDSTDGSAPAVEVKKVEGKGEAAESKSSSAIVSTVIKPEDYLTVLALPLPQRPLFPGFYMPIYVKDHKLLAALVESRKRQVCYAGAFLVKDEPGTDPSKVSSSDTEKNIYELKGKDLLDRLHEVGTFAQITSIQGDQVVLIGHRRLRITELVSEEPLTVKVDHLKEKPYIKDDDVIKATSFEVISTLRDVLKTSSLWRDHVQTYTQHIGEFNYPRLADFGAANKLQCQQVLEELDVLALPLPHRPPDSDTFEISKVSELITKQHWSELKSLISQTNSSSILELLFDSEAEPNVVIAYFLWLQREFQVSHSLGSYCRLFHLLADTKNYSKIRFLLHSFVRNETHSCSSIFHTLSVSPDRFCANSIIVDMLILTYVKNSKTDLAFEAFERAGDYGLNLSLLSCNPLLDSLVKESKNWDVEFVYKEIIKRRINLNVITFNTVINGLCKVGKLQKAEDVVEDMKAWGFEPTVVTYNTLIDGYCKKGRVGKMYKADALLKEMVLKNIFPNEITFNILIGGFCKDDNVSAAMKVFKGMEEQNLRPSVVTYNSLINGLCSAGKLDEALGLKDEMVGLGLKPNHVTYNALINGFCKRKMLKEARELFNQITKQGLTPNAYTFNTLIDGYCKDGQLNEAIVLRGLMLEKLVCATISTYNCLIGGFIREGNLEGANKLVDEMKDKGLRADVVTYNILISALCKKGSSRDAAKLLDEMFEKGLKPTHVTYNTLMAGHCGEGNVRAALNVRRRMEKEGRKPNVVTYNVLIKGFCEKGKLEEANAFLNEMLEKGLVPNRTTYDIVREEMMEKGFVPDIDGHLYNISVTS